MSGNGTLLTPWDLQTASKSGSIQPGHTLWLLPGTYTGDFAFTLSGTKKDRITVRPYQSGKVVIDGSLSIAGNYVDWIDLEVKYSGWTSRVSQEIGSHPTDIPVSKNLTVSGAGHRFYGCHFNNLSGPTCFSLATETQFYNCLFRLNGWTAPDREHGHAIYTQGNTPKLWDGCVFYGNYGYGFCAYTEGGYINDMTVRQCVSFRNGQEDLIGGLKPALRPTIDRCMNYDNSMNLGYVADGGFQDAVITDNYFPGGYLKQGNTQTVTTESGNVTAPEKTNRTFVYPFAWDENRALVVVYNWQKLKAVTVSGMIGKWALTNIENISIQNIVDGLIDMTPIIPASPVAGNAREAGLPVIGCWIARKA